MSLWFHQDKPCAVLPRNEMPHEACEGVNNTPLITQYSYCLINGVPFRLTGVGQYSLGRFTAGRKPASWAGRTTGTGQFWIGPRCKGFNPRRYNDQDRFSIECYALFCHNDSPRSECAPVKSQEIVAMGPVFPPTPHIIAYSPPFTITFAIDI